MQEMRRVEKPSTPSLKDKGSYLRYCRHFWRDAVLIAVFFASMWVMELMNRPFGTVRDLSIPFDQVIPLMPWTIVIYMSWAPLIIALAVVYFLYDRHLMRRYLITLGIGQLMANVTFPFFQTMIPRPYEEVFAGTDIFSKILAIVYRVDNHYCGFPSIHVINCVITMVMIWFFREAKLWVKLLVTIYFGFIAISTVTTKQHVVLDIPGEGLRAHGKFKKRDERMQEHILKAMDDAGLQSYFIYRYPHQFSGGQRQRIGIARSLAMNPKFIVCDEAVSALDVSIQSQIINLLKDLKDEQDLTYLFITHDLSVIKYISDRVAVMYLGNIVELAPTDELFENPRHPYTQALMSAIPTTDLDDTREMIPLEGDIPSPVNPPDGCKFNTRCSYRTEVCFHVVPEWEEVGNVHFVACHHKLPVGSGIGDLKNRSETEQLNSYGETEELNSNPTA
jgi:oligopeptide/dipeptide ABC transporter ATP-binding protein